MCYKNRTKTTRTKTKTKSRTKRANTSKVRRRGSKRSKRRRQIKNLRGGGGDAEWLFEHYPFQEEEEELYAIAKTANDIDKSMKNRYQYKSLNPEARAIIAGYTTLFVKGYVKNNIDGFIQSTGSGGKEKLDINLNGYTTNQLREISAKMKEEYDLYIKKISTCKHTHT